jgi:hypothetical protein
MPIDTISNLCAEGKRQRGIPIEDQDQAAEVARNWKHYWYGLF